MNCAACDRELKPEAGSPETDYQFDNALWIGFHGGYSMFVDNFEADEDRKLPGADAEAVLCHDCSHDLCTANPWIEKLLKPLESHAHTREYWAAHPNHKGWDSPQARLF